MVKSRDQKKLKEEKDLFYLTVPERVQHSREGIAKVRKNVGDGAGRWLFTLSST